MVLRHQAEELARKYVISVEFVRVNTLGREVNAETG
jgi:hypothetical protein